MNLTNKEAEAFNNGLHGMLSHFRLGGIDTSRDGVIKGGLELTPDTINFIRGAGRLAQELSDTLKDIGDRWDRE